MENFFPKKIENLDFFGNFFWDEQSREHGSRGKENYGNIISGLESCSGGLSVIETMSKAYVKRHS